MENFKLNQSSSSTGEDAAIAEVNRGRDPSRSNKFRRNSKSGSRGRANYKDKECYYYHAKGHIQFYYEEMKKDIEELKKNRKKSGETAIVEDDSDGDAFLVQEGKGERTVEDSWILDSACSFHTCANKEWFRSYKSCSGEEAVVLADNHELKIRGIGSVKIKMHDGFVKTFGDVRHVPELRRNLISLGGLDSRGCGFSSRCRVLKVTKGTLVIMKEDLMEKNLYKLIGSVVKSSMKVGACVVSGRKQNIVAPNKRKVSFAMMTSSREDGHAPTCRTPKQIWMKKNEIVKITKPNSAQSGDC